MPEMNGFDVCRALKAHATPIVDTREGDAKLLNGPKMDGDVGHASQDDIDALFD